MLPLPSLVLLNYSKHHLLFSLHSLSVCIYPQPCSSSSHVDRRALCPAFSIHTNTVRDTVHRRMSQTWQIDNTVRRKIHLQHVWCLLCVDSFSTVWMRKLPAQPECTSLSSSLRWSPSETGRIFCLCVWIYSILYISTYFLWMSHFDRTEMCKCDSQHYSTFSLCFGLVILWLYCSYRLNLESHTVNVLGPASTCLSLDSHIINQCDLKDKVKDVLFNKYMF